MSSQIRPFDGWVVIQPIQDGQRRPSGLVLPDNMEKEGVTFGKVVAVGEGRMLDNGTRAPIAFKVGQTVLYMNYKNVSSIA